MIDPRILALVTAGAVALVAMLWMWLGRQFQSKPLLEPPTLVVPDRKESA